MVQKFLSEVDSLGSNEITDKHIILTKDKGFDYKVSYDALLNKLKYDIMYAQFLSGVATDLKFNVDNKFKDALFIDDGMYRWVLCNGQQANKVDYVDYCNKLGITADTFNFPNFVDGTIRNLPAGSTRLLGSFELDAMQSHTHSNTHAHGINDIVGAFDSQKKDSNMQNNVTNTSGGFRTFNSGNNTAHYLNQTFVGATPFERVEFSSHRAGVTATNNATITTDAGTGRLAEETRMKNVAVQIYIKAKFILQP